MYALTGANGQLGRLVVQHLLTQVPANQIIATTRDTQKLADLQDLGVNVRRADFSDPTTLPAAFAGATSLLIISTDVIGARVDLHKAAITAAVAAGVNHVIYTSIPHADPHAAYPLAADHGQTEAALAASGVQWTALRNCSYSDGLKGLLEILLVDGQLLVPAGSAKHSWVTREDCASTAAGALLGKLTISGPVDVTGPEALTFTDLAQRLSDVSGHQVAAHKLPEQELIARIIAQGIPAELADFMVKLASWIASDLPTTPTDIVERASGTRPTSVDHILRTLAFA